MPTQYATASVWPHDHTYEYGGPIDFRLGYRVQPEVVRDWPKKTPLRVHIAQPDERTNLTVIRLRFAHSRGYFHEGVGEKWYSINCWHRSDNTLTIYVKARVIRSVPHPVPVGQWSGTCQYFDDEDGNRALFTFQHMTLRVKQPDKKIVLPDPDTKKSKGGIVLP